MSDENPTLRELVSSAQLRTLLDASSIAERVGEMGKEIALDYAGKDLVLVCILKGSMVFVADLCRAINMPVVVDTLAVASYGTSTVSSGHVRFLSDLRESITDRHVLLVEDIVDTGRTIAHLTRTLSSRDPASLRVATLLDKPSRREIEVEVSYRGFEIPNAFVVGYGLDFAEYFRNLPDVSVLEGPAELISAGS